MLLLGDERRAEGERIHHRAHEHALVPALLERLEGARAARAGARGELDRADQAEVAAVDDVRQALEGVDAVLEMLFEDGWPLEKPFFLVGIEGGDAGRARERVAGIRVAV